MNEKLNFADTFMSGKKTPEQLVPLLIRTIIFLVVIIFVLAGVIFFMSAAKQKKKAKEDCGCYAQESPSKSAS